MVGYRLDHTGPHQVVSDYLLLTLGDALRSWRFVVCSPSMPTVDEISALDKVLMAVSQSAQGVEPLLAMAQAMAYSDALFEHALLDACEREAIFHATLNLGIVICQELLEIKAYLDGVFPYELQGVLPDDTLVLRRIS